MKKFFTPTLIALLAVMPALAQTLVTTAIQPRNAVLEEFTGINCVNCPDGHLRANQLYNAFPGRVVLINIHSGSFANPSSGQPDFRTPWGNPIDAFAGVAAYPSGTMNRVVWAGAYNAPPYFPQNPPNNLAIRRPGWWDTAYPNQGTGAYIILNGGNSPVNIGAATTWNATTRELSVTVELYYTASETQDNKLNVAFTESGVIGYQSGGSANYTHNHILRNLLTGQWGETITTVSQGTLVTRTYSYIVPVNFNIDNCDINVFVTQSDNKNTHTGISIPAKNGTTVGISDAYAAGRLSVYPNPASDDLYISGIPANASEVKVVNVIGKTVLEFDNYENQIKADISKLPAGVYFVNVTTGSKNMVKKFIKD
ncbi:MAG: Omp28-related outer membrane protein [Bacteroidia bacterium]|nr:Omp28-related outer membrane protein [Bacteroidota bacterium]MBK9048865.1 Omp28-related outer membrane protein [Bacteroidota bacterium]MBK9424135.1 Omp28-related outer membrane protein [Bacteroidota bacterium]MBP9082030.1 Omp28-related outer membrane protein [Bacteroidia bacterium]